MAKIVRNINLLIMMFLYFDGRSIAVQQFFGDVRIN